jgi:hypothetical protein
MKSLKLEHRYKEFAAGALGIGMWLWPQISFQEKMKSLKLMHQDTFAAGATLILQS